MPKKTRLRGRRLKTSKDTQRLCEDVVRRLEAIPPETLTPKLVSEIGKSLLYAAQVISTVRKMNQDDKRLEALEEEVARLRGQTGTSFLVPSSKEDNSGTPETPHEH